MKINATTFFITGLIFGFIAIFFGFTQEFNLGNNNDVGVGDQFIHADAAIYACAIIAATCLFTSGLITIRKPPTGV
ncbi:hypothetical protein V9K67_16045 [Paraflavisolibacter sp. H34]|uniref:hypothetical protein n=1 Tax=Huijunlia imazamoxiresistens TaxID=3127457 RepID=UPI0030184770